ncbi:hypothetical protein JCM3766R1_005531 [Sporobolomyces carnicolor]
MHLSNDVFLARLSDLFESRKDVGSVFLTTKRLTYEPASTNAGSQGEDGDAVMKDEGDQVPTASTSTSSSSRDREYPLIVRATDGKAKKSIKVKLSTIVQPQDYLSFTDAYMSILRASLSASLRPKRKRAAAAKSKSKTSKPTATPASETRGSQSQPQHKAVVGFTPSLPKVVGPKRGNGRKKRQAAHARREKIVAKIRKSRDERAKRSGQTL